MELEYSGSIAMNTQVDGLELRFGNTVIFGEGSSSVIKHLKGKAQSCLQLIATRYEMMRSVSI